MERIVYRCVQRTNENTPRRVELDFFSHPEEKEAQECGNWQDSEFYCPFQPVVMCCIDNFTVVEDCEGGVDVCEFTRAPALKWPGRHHRCPGLPDLQSVVSSQRVLDAVAVAEHKKDAGYNCNRWCCKPGLLFTCEGDPKSCYFGQKQNRPGPRATREGCHQNDSSNVEKAAVVVSPIGVNQ